MEPSYAFDCKKENGMKKKKRKQFIPILIATADFANGKKFRIEQVNKRGACRVVDDITKEILGHTHNVCNAWASIRYQAKILHHTERSS